MNASRTSTRRIAGNARSMGFGLWSCALLIALMTTLLPRVAHADVPGRVGRIAFIEGDVQAYSETDPEWKVAYLNQPITSRNSIFVGDAGRAEISVGSTTLAMDAGSQVDIQQLDDNTFEANVVRGRISMRVRRFDPNDVYNVAVPGAEFALLKPGRYRIDALAASGGITVFAGQASIDGDRGAVLVEAGNGMRVMGNANDPNAAPQLFSAAPTAVPLDDWVVAREARFRDSQTERYVSQNMTGYEDLDANGRWSTEEEIGPVWYPTTYVRTDWAPYRYGRWAYVAPWGYTWIDDAPWGFAPFHYGRWVQVGSRWGWTPGAYVARPVYAPALVGFYGGSGFSASFSIGTGPAVGWYPLAPWQRYSPHYTRNTAYINQVNNITIVNPPRRFGGDGARDFNRERGGTLAPQAAFASQRSISQVAIAAPRNFVDRGRPVEVGDLPRPAAIPGAVRRGPDGGNGGGRPDFRSPREFANRPDEGGQRGGPRPAAPVANVPRPEQEAARINDRGLPPTYRRMPEDRRPSLGTEVNRQPQGEAAAQFPRGNGQPDNPGRFNRDGRPQPQQATPTAEGQGAESPRFTPRSQPTVRNDGDNRMDQRLPPVQQPGAPERAFERPNREMRNVQPQPQAQPERQVIERPQAIEQRQPRFERPAPPQIQPQQAPQPAPVERQQRFERPQIQPQPQQQPPRIERPAPQAAPVAQPAPQPRPPQAPPQTVTGPRPDFDRGPGAINRDR